jgi:putative sigma-54 modulation protein
MHIVSRARGMPLSAALKTHIAARLRFALAPVANRVPRVEVWVGDDNGPRGGTDKYCNIRADIDGHASVFVSDQHADLYTAISLAAARAGRAALRSLQRRERLQRARGTSLQSLDF